MLSRLGFDKRVHRRGVASSSDTNRECHAPVGTLIANLYRHDLLFVGMQFPGVRAGRNIGKEETSNIDFVTYILKFLKQIILFFLGGALKLFP